MKQADKPDCKSAAVAEMEEEIKIHYDLLGGTRSLRAAGKQYLPKFPIEGDAGYKFRLKIATLHNVYKKTCDWIVGMILRRPAQLQEKDGNAKFVAEFKKHWENIDNCGTHGDVFLQQVLRDQLAGHVFIVVDAPPLDKIKSKDEQRKANWRPYWMIRRADEAVNFKTEVVDGKIILTRITFVECTTEPDGDFGEKAVTRYRVWRLEKTAPTAEAPAAFSGNVEVIVYRKNDDQNTLGEQEFIEESRHVIPNLKELPVVVAYGEKVSHCVSRPPLRDLGYKNIEHYQDYSDYRRGKAAAGLVIPWMRGQRDGDQKAVGWDVLVKLTGENAEFGFAETTGAALSAHRTALEDVKTEMAEMGLSVMVDRHQKQGMTATQAVIDHTQQSSTLKDIATSLKDAVERATEFHALFMDFVKDDACSVDLGYSPENLVLSVEQATFLLTLFTSKALTLESLWAGLIRGTILPDSFDAEKEMKILKEREAENAAREKAMMNESSKDKD
jgi:hypothetical protein